MIDQALKDRLVSGTSVLVLRCARADMTSTNGFRWPESGEASAPDFIATKTCGNGLHGWLWGAGGITSCNYWSDEGVRWLVVEVLAADVIDLDGKIKFPRGTVVLCGTRDQAVALITEHAPPGTAIMFGTATAGDSGTATAGYSGTATAGYSGTATAGDRGTATAGDRGTATAGYSGTATAGDSGTATAGYSGTATAGDSGTATAGDRGTIAIRYYDAKADRYRVAVADVDSDGNIKPNTAYIVVDGKLVAKDGAK